MNLQQILSKDPLLIRRKSWAGKPCRFIMAKKGRKQESSDFVYVQRGTGHVTWVQTDDKFEFAPEDLKAEDWESA